MSKWIHKGCFIAFEGGEGAGKTTVIKKVAEQLIEEGYCVTVTRAPGGTEFGQYIRSAILNHDHEEPLHPKAVLFAMLADRVQQLEEIIQPALTKGHIVLCDRFYLSSVVYQGVGLGLGVEYVHELSRQAHGHIYPDMNIILDVPVEIGMARTAKRGEQNNYDKFAVEMHERLRQGYLDLGTLGHPRQRVVSAASDEKTVFSNVMQLVRYAIDNH